MMPPSGRATKPTPRVANEASVPTIGSPPGKNACAEVQRGGGAEADEVVGLDHGAGGGAERDTTDVAGAVNGTANVELGLTHGKTTFHSGRSSVSLLWDRVTPFPGSAPLSMPPECPAQSQLSRVDC